MILNDAVEVIRTCGHSAQYDCKELAKILKAPQSNSWKLKATALTIWKLDETGMVCAIVPVFLLPFVFSLPVLFPSCQC